MMYKKMIYFVLLAVVCLALPVSADLMADTVAYWTLDEAIGDTVLDSSGHGHDATIYGDGWQIVTGAIRGAIELTGNDYVLATDFPLPSSTVTVTAWVYANSKPGWGSMVKNWGSSETGQFHLGLDAPGNNLDVHITQSGGGTVNVNEGAAFPQGEWQHVAFTADVTMVRLYRNGAEVGSGVYDGTLKTSHTGVGIGVKPNNEGTGPDAGIPAYWDGLIDDVWILSRGLTPDELQVIMEGKGAGPILQAFGPDPKNGALHEDTWITLSWHPGDFAVSHDVYLGEDYQHVDGASRDSDLFRGNQGSAFLVAGFPGFAYPDGLVPGTTYYWRIDEVNDANPESPWKGNVWSFSIPPKTAYHPEPADGAEFVDPNNVTLSWTPGFGAILHTVYFADNYDQVNKATGGAPRGGATYNPGPLELEKVYYWRVDEFDAALTHKGEVWNFTTPGAVGNPQPAYSAIDVGMNAILSWTASDSAASHELYFGTDKDAVRNADTISPEYKGSKSLGDESHDPGLLDAETAYYWRVDEVDAQGNTAKGPIWIFTTGAFLLIEDFEGYTDNDADGEAIWQTWIDGFGVADNGAQVGYLMPPYAEQSIVHGGGQSMPLLYINEAGVTNSEASMTLTAPRDWTQAGVGQLSLWFRGGSSNAAEPLYAAVSNSAGAPAVVAYDDPGAVASSGWKLWLVPLQAFADQGINLSNVDQIAIGLGTKAGMAAPGGSGTLYVDDIRLSQP
jgi:hypothetical protein